VRVPTSPTFSQIQSNGVLPVCSFLLLEIRVFPVVQLEQERRRSHGLTQALQRAKEQHFTIQQQVTPCE
jgi:hypothetical protein